MKRFSRIRFGSWLIAVIMLLAVASPASAGAAARFGQASVVGYPLLLAKSGLLGFAIVSLPILLGTLAVLIPSMRKVVRKKTS